MDAQQAVRHQVPQSEPCCFSERYACDRSLAVVADELASAGIGEVTPDTPLLGREWPAALEGAWHHMGTTRMHDSPKQGVVDRHCRIHGMSNSYIAGSSVFPTAGANFPTFTLVALSLRLADHIAKQLRALDASASIPPGPDGGRRRASPLRPGDGRDALYPGGEHVLKRHRAQLHIESTLGKGSLFRCDFPPEMIVTEQHAADLSHSA
jgi:hypothetical protein